jgi:hypothetical protein
MTPKRRRTGWSGRQDRALALEARIQRRVIAVLTRPCRACTRGEREMVSGYYALCEASRARLEGGS